MDKPTEDASLAPKAVITLQGWINKADGTRQPIQVVSEEVPLEVAQSLVPEKPKEN